MSGERGRRRDDGATPVGEIHRTSRRHRRPTRSGRGRFATASPRRWGIVGRAGRSVARVRRHGLTDWGATRVDGVGPRGARRRGPDEQRAGVSGGTRAHTDVAGVRPHAANVSASSRKARVVRVGWSPCSRGTLLVEDVRASGRHVAKALARSVDCAVQGAVHPDLLPGDITECDLTGRPRVEFRPGPVFATSSSPTRSNVPRRRPRGPAGVHGRAPITATAPPTPSPDRSLCGDPEPDRDGRHLPPPRCPARRFSAGSGGYPDRPRARDGRRARAADR